MFVASSSCLIYDLLNEDVSVFVYPTTTTTSDRLLSWNGLNYGFYMRTKARQSSYMLPRTADIRKPSHYPSVVTMLGQRLWRSSNIETMLS